MKAFWWQGGLHFRPESDEDREALSGFLRAVVSVKNVHKLPFVPGGTVDSDDEESVVGVEERQEVPAD